MPTPTPLVLLPPSEGKAAGGSGAPWAPGTMALDLDTQREQALTALVRAMRQNQAARAKLLGVKGDALAAATEANRAVREAPTLPAIERYTGVLYDALDIASLRATQRRRLDRSVLIVSGLANLEAEPKGSSASAPHSRSSTAWLTGTHAKPTDGADVRAGVSADQIAASVLGRLLSI